MKKAKKTYRALYYPFIEVNDPGWLFSSALFWEEISTITPDVDQPYQGVVSRELYEASVLTPYRSNPQREEIVSISEQISEFIKNPYFESLIGRDHWSIHQSRDYPISPDKIESNLLHELEQMGEAKKRSDGFIDMEGGLAAAYMLLLSTKVAEIEKSSLVTDMVQAFRASDVARFPQVKFENREYGFRGNRRRDAISTVFVDACINEMVMTWFRLNPETDVRKIIRFRESRKDQLERMRKAIFRANSSILTDDEITYTAIKEKAKKYVHENIQPAYDELERLLREEKIAFIPDTMEASLYSELPGGIVASLGQTWSLVAAPVFSAVIRSVKFYAKRRDTLNNSPWSYLYNAEKSFGTE